MRLCSRKRPSTLRTVFSLSPGIGRRQIPRATMSMSTPAVDAAERLDDLLVDERVHLQADRAGSPRAAAETFDLLQDPSRRNHGPTSSLRNTAGRERPVTAVKTSATSAAMSSSAVKRPQSSYVEAFDSGSCRCRYARSGRPFASCRTRSANSVDLQVGDAVDDVDAARSSARPSMLRRSSNRAFSSTRRTACLPFSAVSTSESVGDDRPSGRRWP